MRSTAVIMNKPKTMGLEAIELLASGPGDVMVDVLWSGISSGTEKLLFTGEMPTFPGMGYPLVPGYESVGRIVEAPQDSDFAVGDLVFVPGSKGFKTVKGLFGATASRLLVDQAKVVSVPETLGEDAVLLALAATAHHALTLPNTNLPDLIIGNGVLGRLLARITTALGGPSPTIWETSPDRLQGEAGSKVLHPQLDEKKDYAAIIDASGDSSILDIAIGCMAKNGAIILAGFYAAPLSLNFAPAFMREASIRIAAEFKPGDIAACIELIAQGKLDLGGLVSHHAPASNPQQAYETAFSDPECIKMVLDWRDVQ